MLKIYLFNLFLNIYIFLELYQLVQVQGQFRALQKHLYLSGGQEY